MHGIPSRSQSVLMQVGKQWEGPCCPWADTHRVGGGQEVSGVFLEGRLLSVFQAWPHPLSPPLLTASFFHNWPVLGVIVTHWVNATEAY